MYRRFSPKTCALACALLFSGHAGHVFAQEDPGYNPTWYILPGANIMSADDDWNVDKNRIGGGLKLGKPISKSFDIQFGGWGAAQKDNDTDLKYRQNAVGADALWLFSRSSFRPFLLLGVGGAQDKLTGNNIDKSKWTPYVNAGGGVQWYFNDRVFTQLDARYVWDSIDDKYFSPENSHSNNGNWLYTLSIGIHFGDRPKPAPVVAAVAAEPAPAPEPTPAAPPPEPKFEKTTIAGSELFGFDSATLKADQPKLDNLADLLSHQTDVGNVQVTGYTDRLGSEKYNQKLSERRANAVKDYLVSKGIAADRITAVGKGKADPVVTCEGVKKRKELIECLAPNRRVELEPFTIERKVQ
ncbi:OmpA family protein [Niveibacterium sp. SC-1]|uniref:OmpA family protein n=1 Tax=Niveibacterium sp. SC-1 TaxID=3135646 RepID=UPI00311E2CB8